MDNDDRSLKHKYLGKIKVRVDQVYGKDVDDDDLPWAEPCFPMGGGRPGEDEKISHGFISIPPKGSSVWVMFEQGEADKPVWIGTWYGEKDATPEMPDEAVRDPSGGAVYPEVHLIKFPQGSEDEGIFIRCSGDNKLEFVFGENKIQLDKLRQRISISAEDWNINAETQQGDIFLQAPNGDIRIMAGKDILLVAGGTINSVAGETGHYHAGGINVFSSESAIHGRAPVASGFDRHPV